MSWDRHLWDQHESLATYSDISIECIKQYGSFLDKRSEYEFEYSSKLNKLYEKYLSNLSHVIRRAPEIKNLSWYRSLTKVLTSNKQLSNQHETISIELKKLITRIEQFVEKKA